MGRLLDKATMTKRRRLVPQADVIMQMSCRFHLTNLNHQREPEPQALGAEGPRDIVLASAARNASLATVALTPAAGAGGSGNSNAGKTTAGPPGHSSPSDRHAPAFPRHMRSDGSSSSLTVCPRLHCSQR